MSGYIHVWLHTRLVTHTSGYIHVWIHMSGYIHVWLHTRLVTHVWLHTRLVTHTSGYTHVWLHTSGYTHVWLHTRLVTHVWLHTGLVTHTYGKQKWNNSFRLRVLFRVHKVICSKLSNSGTLSLVCHKQISNIVYQCIHRIKKKKKIHCRQNWNNSRILRVSEGTNMQSVFWKQALKKVNMS